MRIAGALSLLCLWADVASAGKVDSIYTEYDLSKCRLIAESEEGPFASYMCKGLGGIDIYFAEGDLRGMVAIGKDPENHCAARQSFGPFNSANRKIEWRTEDGRPFAAIQRWHVSDPEESEKSYSWLVVTALGRSESCRVAIIEGALPDANAKAREAADGLARNFDCARDEATVFSRAPMRIGDIMWGSPCTQE
jgi:hypothetical protein